MKAGGRETGKRETTGVTDVLRVGVVRDLASEGWPSMDLVADMLLSNLAEQHAGEVEASGLCPESGQAHVSGNAPGRWSTASASRMVNRYWRYPRWLRRLNGSFDVFHVVDHSYAHLVHVLPPDRTVVTCHDTDAFRPIVEPGCRESRLPLAIVRHAARGLRKAAVVACDSEATRAELESFGLVRAERLAVVPIGVQPGCAREEDDAAAGERASRLLGRDGADSGELLLLHVGSTIPRKRIDVLLHVFREVRAGCPGARLVRVGGPFTAGQRRLADDLGVTPHIVSLPFLDRATLAAVYRRAALVLLTSEREGFGLPVVEAMASGTPVVATDIPVLREVGGEAAAYCPLGDFAAWRDTVLALLEERRSRPERWKERVERGVSRASRFTWQSYAGKMVEIYRNVTGAGAREVDGCHTTGGQVCEGDISHRNHRSVTSVDLTPVV